jgi:hypothetical protein
MKTLQCDLCEVTREGETFVTFYVLSRRVEMMC